MHVRYLHFECTDETFNEELDSIRAMASAKISAAFASSIVPSVGNLSSSSSLEGDAERVRTASSNLCFVWLMASLMLFLMLRSS